jgi:glycopeptide antibiotics resistance protein
MFKLTASSNILGAFVRLGLGGGFTVVLYRACGWSMLGHGLSIYVTAGIIFIGLWLALHGRETSAEPLPSMRLYLFQSFFILAAYAILMTSDVVLVKHYLPDDTEFSFAATLGRMVAFLPGAIVMAMFPKVSSKGTMTREQQAVFLRSFWYTALFVTVAVLGCAVFPELLRKILYGRKVFSPEFSQLIRSMAVVMGLSALLNVNVHFLLAQRRFKACIVVIACACGYLLCGHLFHASAWQIVAAAAAFNGIALVLTGYSIISARPPPSA